MAVRPLRPATDRCFGRPLPCQLANQTRAHPVSLKSFPIGSCDPTGVRGITSRFQLLFPDTGQITHALLTRPPLRTSESIRRLLPKSSVRLACVRHAASVHPEPGSNSHVFIRLLLFALSTSFEVSKQLVLIMVPYLASPSTTNR